jgi:hypothetical protein
MVNVELTRQTRSCVAVLDAELAARSVAIGVHRGLGHAELAGDLLRRQVLIHEAQAFAFARREQRHGVLGNDVACDHSESS